MEKINLMGFLKNILNHNPNIEEFFSFLKSYKELWKIDWCDYNFPLSLKEKKEFLDKLILKNLSKAEEEILKQFEKIENTVDVSWLISNYEKIIKFDSFNLKSRSEGDGCENLLRFYITVELVKKCNNFKDLFCKLRNRTYNLTKKRLLLHVLSYAPLPTRSKLSLFIDWKENPIIELLKNFKNEEEFVEWIKIGNGHISTNSVLFWGEYTNVEKFYLYRDLWYFIKNCIDPSTTRKEREEIKKMLKEMLPYFFQRAESIANKLNSKLYLDFYKNEKSKNDLQTVYSFIENFSRCWNKILLGIFKIDDQRNKQKNIELFHLKNFLDSPVKIDQIKDIQIPTEEPPDFILITENKKIAVELFTFDSEEDIKQSPHNVSLVKSISSTSWKITKDRIEDRISKKKEKLKNMKDSYDEIYLLIHFLTVEGMTEYLIFKKIEGWEKFDGLKKKIKKILLNNKEFPIKIFLIESDKISRLN